MQKRREFIKMLGASTAAVVSFTGNVAFSGEAKTEIIKPPKLNPGDMVGLITPASPLFETNQEIIEAVEKMKNLGFIILQINKILTLLN